MRRALWLRYILVWSLSRVYIRISLFICAPALADVRENLRHLQEQIGSLSLDVGDLQSQVDGLDATYVEQSDFDSLERDVEDLRDTVDGLDRDITEFERTLDEVKFDVDTLKENIDAA